MMNMVKNEIGKNGAGDTALAASYLGMAIMIRYDERGAEVMDVLNLVVNEIFKGLKKYKKTFLYYDPDNEGFEVTNQDYDGFNILSLSKGVVKRDKLLKFKLKIKNKKKGRVELDGEYLLSEADTVGNGLHEMSDQAEIAKYILFSVLAKFEENERKIVKMGF